MLFKKKANAEEKPDPFDLEERIKLCQEYTETWSTFFNFFGDGFTGRKITNDTESQFFRILTDLARRQFRVSYFLGKDLKGAKDVITILNTAVNLSNIVGMSEAQLSKFQQDWHVFFIALNKCRGRLIAQRPPEEESASGRKAKRAKKAKKEA